MEPGLRFGDSLLEDNQPRKDRLAHVERRLVSRLRRKRRQTIHTIETIA
jgi:hypothetical protein